MLNRVAKLLTSDTEAKEMFANLVVKESLEKVAGDWDFLQEKVK